MYESKPLVVEKSEDDGAEGFTSQSIADELIEKASSIDTSMWCLSKKTHDGHIIKTKVIFGKNQILIISWRFLD